MQQSIANMARFEASHMYHTQEVAQQLDMVRIWFRNLVESAEHDDEESRQSLLVRV
jgi:hypothetical protein